MVKFLSAQDNDYKSTIRSIERIQRTSEERVKQNWSNWDTGQSTQYWPTALSFSSLDFRGLQYRRSALNISKSRLPSSNQSSSQKRVFHWPQESTNVGPWWAIWSGGHENSYSLWRRGYRENTGCLELCLGTQTWLHDRAFFQCKWCVSHSSEFSQDRKWAGQILCQSFAPWFNTLWTHLGVSGSQRHSRSWRQNCHQGRKTWLRGWGGQVVAKRWWEQQMASNIRQLQWCRLV